MNKIFIITLLLFSTSAYAQDISDILEKALSGVVTVAVIESNEEKELLGSKGNESKIAYEKALDLSNFATSGSGFVIEREGKKYVVTNAHVVESAKSGEGNLVVFSINRTRYAVKILGGDTFYDLALLEFITPPGNEISTLNFRQGEARIGERVYAIGNPMGEFPYSVSDGIISARNRIRDVGPTGKFGFLQTTATVIWGNSGGPLIDDKGLVTGINSQIYIMPIEGQIMIQPQINFALEAPVAQRIVNDILSNNGLVRRVFLGLEFSQAYEDYSYGKGLWIATDSLPVITGVIPGSPSASCAIDLTGCIVMGVNGTTIGNIEDILGEIEKMSPGQDITLTINKTGEIQDITIYPGEMGSPQLTSVCRYFFEMENGATLSTGPGQEVIFTAGSGNPANNNTGYSTKKSSGLFNISNQEKIIVSAGLNSDKEPMMWRIRSLTDLGAVLRLCGPYGFISLKLLDRNSAEAVPETIDISLSGGTTLKKTLWY